MKRAHPRKLRDRRTGMSPYARYGKCSTTYSPAYQQWKENAKRGHVRSLAATEEHAP